MDFRIEHTFAGIDPDRYLRLYFDDAYNVGLLGPSNLKERRVLEDREVNGVRTRRVHIVPARDLPDVVKKVAGPNGISYTDEAVYKLGGRVIEGRVSNDKVDVRYTVEALPAAGGGTTRLMKGSVTCRVPLVGRLIEQAIVGDMLKSYDAVARFTQQWVADGKAIA